MPETVDGQVRGWLWALCLLLVGCTMDPRPQALRRGLDQVRSVLADPRLRTLAEKTKKGPIEERLVEALFSPEGHKYWPPPLEAEYDYNYQDQSKLPGRIAYLREPDVPWSVVVLADPERNRILLLGYGMQLDQPLLRDSMPVPPTQVPAKTSSVPGLRPLDLGSIAPTVKPPVNQVQVAKVLVAPGDCVWRLLQQLGWSNAEILARRLVAEVPRVNRLSDPDLIFSGQLLLLPRRAA